MKTSTCILLQISEDTYHNIEYATGEAFAMHYCGNDYEGSQLLLVCPAFWQWWRNQVSQRAEAFVKLHGNPAPTPKRF